MADAPSPLPDVETQRSPLRSTSAHQERPRGSGAHPAVWAWRQLHAGSSTHLRVTTLRRSAKSTVYRLERPGRAAMIAKRSRADGVRTERLMYEEVLPRLPLRVLPYHGVVEESDAWWWLFVQDAGGERFSLFEHPELAGSWLGALHGSGVALGLGGLLPDRGSDHFLAHLRSAQARILRYAGNPVLKPSDRSVLTYTMACCRAAERGWARIEELCAELPPTVVHGDVKGGNLRIAGGQGGPIVLAFDWEYAGWGPPVADLEVLAYHAGAAHYWRSASEFWSELRPRQIPVMARLGRLLRVIAAINWSAAHLVHPWPENGMLSLRLYTARLPSLLGAVGILV